MMTHEVILFATLQGVLGVLLLIVLRWTKGIAKDLAAIRASVTESANTILSLTGRMNNVEHEQEVSDGRLERVAGRASDLSIAMERLDATIGLCPSCPHPGQQHGRDIK